MAFFKCSLFFYTMSMVTTKDGKIRKGRWIVTFQRKHIDRLMNDCMSSIIIQIKIKTIFHLTPVTILIATPREETSIW